MLRQVFKTRREFNNAFPSKIFVCPICEKLTPNPMTCPNCGFRADGLVKTMGMGFLYVIEEEGPYTHEIFRLVEAIKKEGEENAN